MVCFFHSFRVVQNLAVKRAVFTSSFYNLLLHVANIDTTSCLKFSGIPGSKESVKKINK